VTDEPVVAADPIFAANQFSAEISPARDLAGEEKQTANCDEAKQDPPKIFVFLVQFMKFAKWLHRGSPG